ncbi:UNVERIFIED_CONTAM: hypothetical protein K2H54_040595 [Gekko kuhli]
MMSDRCAAGERRSSVGGNSGSECRYRGSSTVRISESEGRAGAEVESEGRTEAEETVVGTGVVFLGRFGSGGPEGASEVPVVPFPGFFFSLVGRAVGLCGDFAVLSGFREAPDPTTEEAESPLGCGGGGEGVGKPFETTKILNAVAANIIVSILLGKRYEYKDPTYIRLLNLFYEMIQLLESPSVVLYNMFPALGFLSGGRKTILKHRDELHAFIQATFIEHLKELDVNDQRSFIDAFLIQQQEEKNKNQSNGFFHNENLKTVVENLFGAGMESTSNTLRWGLLLMMKYPEIQKKVQDEITKVIGSAQPRIEHRAKLPYTDAVIHEVQRFANIIPMNMPHATTADVTLGDYFIPKGTHIVPLLYSVLYDESEWEKPLKFYPEHFLDSEGKFVKRDAFMPFSTGRRVCAGETLARMELFLFFVSLLQRFTFQPAPGMSKEDLDLTPAAGFTTPPMAYNLCALPRS